MAGFITFSRNEVWKTNVTLMKDTVAQNPKKRVLHDIYIRSLLNAGMIKEAEQQYRYALSVAPAGNNASTDLGIAEHLIIQKRYREALQLYQDANVRTSYSSEKLLSASIQLLTSMQQTENLSQDEKKRLTTLEHEYRNLRSEMVKKSKVN
jgi:thioredoxin-like negative regulator of GroEL